jgi:hypothetical protein
MMQKLQGEAWGCGESRKQSLCDRFVYPGNRERSWEVLCQSGWGKATSQTWQIRLVSVIQKQVSNHVICENLLVASRSPNSTRGFVCLPGWIWTDSRFFWTFRLLRLVWWLIPGLGNRVVLALSPWAESKMQIVASGICTGPHLKVESLQWRR